MADDKAMTPEELGAVVTMFTLSRFKKNMEQAIAEKYASKDDVDETFTADEIADIFKDEEETP